MINNINLNTMKTLTNKLNSEFFINLLGKTIIYSLGFLAGAGIVGMIYQIVFQGVRGDFGIF